jgi:hypothetical protein
MKTSELIAELQLAMSVHGDLPVVSGMHRTGYGEPVSRINYEGNGKDAEDKPLPVIDLVLGNESIVAIGGF